MFQAIVYPWCAEECSLVIICDIFVSFVRRAEKEKNLFASERTKSSAT